MKQFFKKKKKKPPLKNFWRLVQLTLCQNKTKLQIGFNTALISFARKKPSNSSYYNKAKEFHQGCSGATSRDTRLRQEDPSAHAT